MSSIVRRLYYHQHITYFPKVVIGTPDSWNQTVSIFSKGYSYSFCTWSPCGRFIAAQTETTVEIRNQLTLELLTTLHSTETNPHLTGPLAYSPDGCFLACATDSAIIIWDRQTGGVANEINCTVNNISLVWSLDGRTIATIKDQGSLVLHMYDLASGEAVSPGALQSKDSSHLWSNGGFFWIMVAAVHGRNLYIHISKVEPTLIQTESLLYETSMYDICKIGAFSPTTYHISYSDTYSLHVMDIQKNCLLKVTGHYFSHCFSSDGSLFAASNENSIHIWKYNSYHYTLWREFQCQGWSNSPLQFSPTPSSIMGHLGNILQVWHLYDPRTTPKTHHQQFVCLHHSGTFIVTAHESKNTITITNILSQTPSQFINADVNIEGLAITGNILLVVGSGELIAWQLTEEGVVGGASSNGTAGYNDSIWAVALMSYHADSWVFTVEGQIGAITYHGGNVFHVYHIETGEIIHPPQAPQHFGSHWYHFNETLLGQHYLHCHNLSQCITPPEDEWQTSQATLQEGWVKDSKGKHRLWVPVEWRMSWDCADWHHDVTTQFSILGGMPVVIKF